MPRGHHRRVVSDTSSITGMLTEEDMANIDFENLQLESTVIPDHHLKDNLAEQMALYSGKFEPEAPSITLDFFLSLAVCNTVVISVEQQTKIVKTMARQRSSKLTPLENITTPVKRIYKEFKKRLVDVKESDVGPAIIESSNPADESGVHNESFLESNFEQTGNVPQQPRTLLTLPRRTPPKTTLKPRPISLQLTVPLHKEESESDLPECDQNKSENSGNSDTHSYASTLELTPAIIIPKRKEVTFDYSLLTPATEFGEAGDDRILDPKDVLYEAESPDEAALVYAAKGYGVTLMKRKADQVLVQWPNEESPREYNIIAVLPFDSHRKMMSVIVKNKKSYILLTKGADSAVFNCLRHDQKEIQLISEVHVERFAREGLRTLAFGRRYMALEEVMEIKRKILELEASTEDSELFLRKLYADVERDLEFLGVTAIEDRLQQGVPDRV